MEQNSQLSFQWILDKTEQFDNATENNELQKETENSLSTDVYKIICSCSLVKVLVLMISWKMKLWVM